MLGIKLLQLFILRGETALGGGVYDENHFVGVLFQRYGAAFSVFDREIINSLHFYNLINDLLSTGYKDTKKG